MGGLATGKSRLQFGGLLLEVNAHQPRRGKRDKQQRQDVTKDVSDSITRRDIGLLLAQDIVGKPELRQRSSRRSYHGRLRETAGRKTCSRAGIQMKDKGEGENERRPVVPTTRATPTCDSVRKLSEAKNSGPDL